MAASSDVLSLKILENMFMTILHNCKNMGTLKKIHAQIIKFSLSQSSYLVTKMVNICDQHEQVGYAELLFKEVSEPSIYLYNALIRAHTHRHLNLFAVYLYKQMLEEAVFLDNSPSHLSYGRVEGFPVFICPSKFMGMSSSPEFNQILLLKVHFWMKRARQMFEEMPEKSVVSWTAMISGYTRTGICTQLGALELGKWIHFYAEKNGFLQRTSLCNALIEMYAKSGNIDQAWQVFDKMLERDVISWSTMVGGLANHGKALEAIRLFHEMQKTTTKPNEITFIGLLSACAHAGLLEDGLRYFNSMTTDYNLEPGIEHYGCMVDLLGRTGCLDQALELIKTLPMKPDAVIWGSLLSSCRIKGNAVMAVIAMEHVLELEPEDAGNYVLLSNIYADLGRWDGGSRVRKLIRGKLMSKKPGLGYYWGKLLQMATATYPPPPPYYRQYKDYEQDPTSAPEPPPPIQGTYLLYGSTYTTDDVLPSLEDQGVRQLYPKGPNVDFKKELRSLNREMQLHILELADVLIERPSQYARRVEDISLLFKNLHHLLNSLRPHQARSTLIHILELQIQRRKQAVEDIKRRREEAQRLLKEALGTLEGQ
ncbi:hypothetical protein L1987_00411 [Smallanthus sonchifolius]|uniref:Uncharacterized protein n=1 Tax=Smallanthus sonchifolius TaxID=185202 RepID=A0ACB9K265_9ASTR|nr:hypothetical protein L1987_00411 [Smallanthus sonchifolius]